MKVNWGLVLLSILATGFIYAAFFAMNHYLDGSREDTKEQVLENNYTVDLDGTVYQNVSPEEFSFGPVSAGTVIEYSVLLPFEELRSPMLTIYTCHSEIEVWLDGELIYSYGQDKERMYGYGYLYVPIRERYGGKTLRIVQTVHENGEVSSIEPLVLTSDSGFFFRNMAIDHRYELLTDFAVIILGIIFSTLALLFMRNSRDTIRLVFLAVSIFGMGMWVFCNYNLMAIFTDDLAIRGYVEYPALYFSPYFFSLYFGEDFYTKEKSKRRYVYVGIVTLQGLFALWALPLHFLDIRHLPTFLPECHILLVAGLGFITYMSLRAVRRKENNHRAFLVGLVLLVLFGLRDLLRFFYFHYVTHGQSEKYESHMLLGIFLFSICMFMDFFAIQKRRLAAEAQARALDRMAHTDMMTGLANRRGCEKAFTNLADSHATFGMIGFDLNDLKKTNDTFGHAAGDQLLTDFSDLLDGVFRKQSAADDLKPEELPVVGRMGGDEFLVVLPNVKTIYPEKRLEELAEKRDEMNRTRTPLPLSYAYGYCRSDDPQLSEGGVSPEGLALVSAVYKCSDSRMYENKLKIKAARKEFSPDTGKESSS